MAIPNTKLRLVSSSGVAASGEFGISLNDSAHIMTILRDTLYSDKVLAVLREYSSNAWDAHIESGKKDVPIKVTLPTEMDPTLSIRDFGAGLSQEDVFTIYTQYGASTKRNEDGSVGMLGIGCLLKGQPIVTLDGMKAVDEIQKGDSVLTHKNRFRRVTKLMRRPYKGRAYRVWLSQAKKPLILTEEHPILVSDHEGNQGWSLPGEIATGYRTKKKGIKAWNSYAVLPATMHTLFTKLSVEDHLDDSYEVVGGKWVKTTEFQNSKNGIPHRVESYRVTEWEGFPETLDLDEELGWLLGLYAAEGSCTRKQVTLTLNVEERGLADRFTSGMRRLFGIEFKWYERPEKNILELVAHHTALACLLGSLCGCGAENKKAPLEVMGGTNEVRRGFLRGVFDGDGSSTRSRFVFGVASPRLAWAARTLMAVTEGKWGSVGTMEDYPNRWSIHYDREAEWSYSFKSGDYLLRPIERIEPFDLESEVFNFSVDEDESYVSDFVLHNCKSAFAYSDSFTVTSWHAGEKKTYVAVLDPSEKGVINLLDTQPCGDETGVLIQVAVKPQDNAEFVQKAKYLFKYFEPRPETNIEIPALPTKLKLTNGVLFDLEDAYSWKPSNWVAIMGCVAYKISLSQLEGVAEFLKHNSGALYFNIGDIQVSASREELKYNDNTKAKIVEKLNALVDEYVIHTISSIEKLGLNDWGKRLEMQIFSRLQLPVPKDSVDLSAGNVVIKDKIPTSIEIQSCDRCDRDEVERVSVNPASRFLLWDDNRTLPGFHLRSYDLLVKPEGKKKTPISTVQADLETMLKNCRMEGIRVQKLSELEWHSNYRGSGKMYSVNHRRWQFELANRDDTFFPYPRSKCWLPIHREPTPDDAYVILTEFKVDKYDLYSLLKEDIRLAKAFDSRIPPIYGYKSTGKHPVEPKDCVGVPYKEWRVSFAKSLLNTRVQDLINRWCWMRILNTGYAYSVDAEDKTRRVNTLLSDEIGSTHPIADLFRRHQAEKNYFKGKKSSLTEGLELLVSRPGVLPVLSEAVKAYQDIQAKYPLLTLPEVTIEVVWGKNHGLWCQYIRTVDALEAQKGTPNPCPPSPPSP